MIRITDCSQLPDHREWELVFRYVAPCNSSTEHYIVVDSYEYWEDADIVSDINAVLRSKHGKAFIRCNAIESLMDLEPVVGEEDAIEIAGLAKGL